MNDKARESDKEVLKRVMSEPTFENVREASMRENEKRRHAISDSLRQAYTASRIKADDTQSRISLQENISLHIGASDEEVAEVESLASERSVLHWPAILRIIKRMRSAEASADHAWQRVEAGDRRYESLERDFLELVYKQPEKGTHGTQIGQTSNSRTETAQKQQISTATNVNESATNGGQ